MMRDWNNQARHSPWDQGTSWESWLMFALMILFIIAVVVAIVYVVRLLKQPSAATPAAPKAKPDAGAIESPQDILKRRYAAGEIDREEYLQKLGDL